MHTDSDEIIEACKKYNILTIKTKRNFKNGTERIASVAKKFKNYLIVDVQGDEPLTSPKTIDKVVNFHLKNKFNPEIVIPTRLMSHDPSETNVRVISSKTITSCIYQEQKVPYNYKNSCKFC